MWVQEAENSKQTKLEKQVAKRTEKARKNNI